MHQVFWFIYTVEIGSSKNVRKSFVLSGKNQHHAIFEFVLWLIESGHYKEKLDLVAILSDGQYKAFELSNPIKIQTVDLAFFNCVKNENELMHHLFHLVDDFLRRRRIV